MTAAEHGLRATFNDAWLIDGVRTPFVDYRRAFVSISPIDLGIKAARAAIAKAGADPVDIGTTIALPEVRLTLPAFGGSVDTHSGFAIGMPYVAITKAYDYLAMGRPIIAANLPSIRDVLRHGREALLFAPGESSDEHQERRFRQMEVGEQHVDGAKSEAGKNEELGLAIEGFEFTQAIQHYGTGHGPDNSVPLVALKPMVVRVYPVVVRGLLGGDALSVGAPVTGSGDWPAWMTCVSMWLLCLSMI